MKKRNIIILVLFIVSIAAFVYFFTHRLPGDIEVKGADRIGEIVPLVTAVVSLATAIITLIATRQKGQSTS